MDEKASIDFFSSQVGNVWADKDIISLLLKRYPKKIAPLLEKIYDVPIKIKNISAAADNRDEENKNTYNILVAGVELPERHEDMQQIKHKLTNTKHNIVFDTINPFGKGKFEHLNAVLNKYNVNNFDWIIITDDDIDVPENFVDKFIFLADFFDLQISQPAHNFVSYATYSVTRRHWNSIARITNFVEIGPIFMLHRTVFSEILPFPEVGMGWGLDIYWSLLARERNWRMGIIDALPIRHLRPIGKSYDRHMALHEAEKLLKKYPMVPREEILRTEKFFRNLRI